MIKRLFDVFFGTLGLMVATPILILLAIAIKMEDRGPVLFKQSRIGRNRKSFEMYKLRSMRSPRPFEKPGPFITFDTDDRITKVGRVIRATKIDEVPQLLNVIRGDMSIVGPRPEVNEYVELWNADLRCEILSVRPGLTDPASIKLRHESTLLAKQMSPTNYYVDVLLPAKTRIYADYVRSQTFVGDLRIIADTVKAVLVR